MNSELKKQHGGVILMKLFKLEMSVMLLRGENVSLVNFKFLYNCSTTTHGVVDNTCDTGYEWHGFDSHPWHILPRSINEYQYAWVNGLNWLGKGVVLSPTFG